MRNRRIISTKYLIDSKQVALLDKLVDFGVFVFEYVAIYVSFWKKKKEERIEKQILAYNLNWRGII